MEMPGVTKGFVGKETKKEVGTWKRNFAQFIIEQEPLFGKEDGFLQIYPNLNFFWLGSTTDCHF